MFSNMRPVPAIPVQNVNTGRTYSHPSTRRFPPPCKGNPRSNDARFTRSFSNPDPTRPGSYPPAPGVASQSMTPLVLTMNARSHRNDPDIDNERHTLSPEPCSATVRNHAGSLRLADQWHTHDDLSRELTTRSSRASNATICLSALTIAISVAAADLRR